MMTSAFVKCFIRSGRKGGEKMKKGKLGSSGGCCGGRRVRVKRTPGGGGGPWKSLSEGVGAKNRLFSGGFA